MYFLKRKIYLHYIFTHHGIHPFQVYDSLIFVTLLMMQPHHTWNQPTSILKDFYHRSKILHIHLQYLFAPTSHLRKALIYFLSECTCFPWTLLTNGIIQYGVFHISFNSVFRLMHDVAFVSSLFLFYC